MNKVRILVKEIVGSLLIAVLTTVLGFAYVEPGIISGQSAEEEFTVKQIVTAEITFVVAPSDIVMKPDIAGITGGTGNGGTQFRVRTNNGTGFFLTIETDSDIGMIGEQFGDAILHLVTATPEVPDFLFNSAPANSSAFAYTVNATTTSDLVQAFLDDGGACNTGASQAEERCWIAATTSARTILNRSTATPASGATSTLRFRAIIAADPQPEISADTYTATTTLTATMN